MNAVNLEAEHSAKFQPNLAEPEIVRISLE